MSCNNCSNIKNNCVKNCSKLKTFFSWCFPCLAVYTSKQSNTNEEDNDEVKLSNKDFNNKRTPSLNDYIVKSYINKGNPKVSVPDEDDTSTKDE